ncbi:metallophosphoesterase family protein [Winogradskya consettensis]|uniref:metallophosphoesterase family protein n=1 Tax=Winogradskya consettensis TaxID=113560 RepID=UPI001FD4F217|nr:metallophosphoesterase [Actinoplanes consettensis]
MTITRANAVANRVWRHVWTRRLGRWAAVLLVGLTGVVVGVMLLAHTQIGVGPFRADMSITPSIQGGTEIDIPPLGSLHLDSHDGPIHLKVDLGSLDQERTAALIDDPTAISAAGQSAVDDVTKGVMQLGLRALGAAIVCSLILSALIFRNIRKVAAAGVLALVVTGGSLGLAAGTVRPDSISEPRYEGLLVNAPAVVGDARKIADNYGRYADQLAELVSNVSRIYTTVSTLPVQPAGNTTRILHISDLHLNPASWSVIKTVVKQWDIDAIIDTGDIVDWGSSAETTYVNNIATVGVPYIYVRGNHDSSAIQAAVARQKNAKVLDNTIITINGLTIAGIGDPEFTPDKSETEAPANSDDLATNPLLAAGDQLADTIRAAKTRVGVALVHDPAMAPPLSGTVPLVLAGHTHKREVSVLGAPTADPSASPAASPAPATAPIETRLLVEGSTGGAGLRGLEKEEPTPLQMSVLYFDENQSLKAYDDIQLGGTGQSNVTVQRNVVGAEDPRPTTNPSVVNGVTPSR